MPTTDPAFGWTVPEDSDALADGAAAMRTLAGDIAGTLAVDDPTASIPFAWSTIGTFTFVAGSVDVSWPNVPPAGWEWYGIPVPVFYPRSNARPSIFYNVAVGNLAVDGCTIHLRGSDGSAPAGNMAVVFTLIGRIRRSA